MSIDEGNPREMLQREEAIPQESNYDAYPQDVCQDRATRRENPIPMLQSTQFRRIKVASSLDGLQLFSGILIACNLWHRTTRRRTINRTNLRHNSSRERRES